MGLASWLPLRWLKQPETDWTHINRVVGNFPFFSTLVYHFFFLFFPLGGESAKKHELWLPTSHLPGSDPFLSSQRGCWDMPGHAAIAWAFSAMLLQAGHVEVPRHTQHSYIHDLQYKASKDLEPPEPNQTTFFWDLGKNHHWTKKWTILKTFAHIQHWLILFCCMCPWLCSETDRREEASKVEQSTGDCDNWPRCCYHWVPVLSPPNPSGPVFNLTQDFHSLQG